MSADLDLDAIKARVEAATPGPWKADGGEVSQHWSRPEPWQEVVSTEVSCMSYCYGGTARGVERDADAEFIAHARTDVPALVAEVERLRAREGRVRALAARYGEFWRSNITGLDAEKQLRHALDGYSDE